MQRPLALVALALALTACDDEPVPATLDLSWQTGLLTCVEAGVSTVRAELYGYGAAEPVRASERLCTDPGLVLTDIGPGDYTIQLKGLDDDGCWTHGARRDIDLAGGAALSVDLPLVRRNRPLYIRWPFENELDCQGNAISQVNVRVDVEDRFSYEADFVCPGLAGELPATVPAGELRVQITALDDQQRPAALGRITAPEDIFTDNPCEDRIEVRVPLTLCVNPECEGERPR